VQSKRALVAHFFKNKGLGLSVNAEPNQMESTRVKAMALTRNQAEQKFAPNVVTYRQSQHGKPGGHF
jgi:hypothetical protein